jgi:hypothetical protein
MKKIIKKIIKYVLILLAGISVVGIIIFGMHFIPCGELNTDGDREIYLSDNGIHVDIVIPENGKYNAYGWGSKIFFMEVPTWDDLTFTVGFQALFTKPESVIRVTTYNYVAKSWTKVKCSEKQYQQIKKEIESSFKHKNNYRINVRDNFYQAVGSYWALNTCNTWVNSVLKKAGLRSCLFTLTSSSIIDKYK